MARIRTIKPSFFESEDVAALPLRARLLWIGLWTHCDDAGRTKDNVKLVKARIWPLDQVTLAEIEDDLITLADHGRIVRYEVAGQRFLEIANWSEHQNINRPSPSKIPPPPLNGSSLNPHGALTDGSLQEGKGREGKGREARAAAHDGTLTENSSKAPSPKCEEHKNLAKPPACGDCADARKNYENWMAERNARQAAATRCPKHRGQPANNCAMCRSERIGAS